MLRILFGIFIILHGLVHLLYFGQSARYFELQPGMVWPDGSWAFSKLLGNSATRNLASALLVLTAIGLVIGGVGIFANQSWWQTTIIGSTVFSTVTYVLLWDGSLLRLDNKGGMGILINVGILVAVLAWNRSW